MKLYGRSKTPAYLVLAALAFAVCALQPTSAVAQMTHTTKWLEARMTIGT